ncbi:nucleotide sugar dehydrogenase [Candidatus Marinimicrobia bacterium]|nr:nucleotide sugar dehydrogenase [Candidatus Neomarinimicrobiota bacterium]
MNKQKKITVVGLGYVGLPLAVQLSKKYVVVGYDLNNNRIFELTKGYDRTNELDDKDLKQLKNIFLTSDIKDLKDSNYYIITVPTPVDKNNKPDLKPIISASKTVGGNLSKNNTVIYESTVFPGCTEEVCVPILEEHSHLEYNKDFFCGYSPERINPGDKKHTLTNVAKIVSGSNTEVLDDIYQLYKNIINAQVFKVKSIKVAEAAKVIENTQRDVNIALINELAIIFDKMGINSSEVLEAASTKWNFLPFKPGLVGGHCIGVDPYYLTHKATEVGHHPEMILAGRKINDSMGDFIVQRAINQLTKKGINPVGANIGIFGLTFKENCPDTRNTKVFSVIEHLKIHKSNIIVVDNWASPDAVLSQFGLVLTDISTIKNLDLIILCVGHKEFKKIAISKWEKFLVNNGILMDVKSLYSKDYLKKTKITYWSL